jgi:peptide/nickel transport system permease protein
MLNYLLKRLLIAIPVLLGVSIIAFALVRAVPGDTVTAMLGANYSEAEAAALRERYGLDRPLIAQYALWLGRVLTGDFGTSAFTGRPVLDVILERLPVTLQLAAFAIAFAIVIGIPLGVVSALRQRNLAGYTASFAGLIGISVPGFWLGTILILAFSLGLGWLPSGGFVGIDRSLVENLRHMILPALALGTAVAAVVMRMSRTAMLTVIHQDYIRTARAKGTPESRVLLRHALKNAMIPIITILGLQAGYLIGGSVVIEHVFSLPGVGRLALQAIGNRDYALLQGVVLFVAIAFVLINLAVDLLYAFFDPRIRLGGGDAA